LHTNPNRSPAHPPPQGAFGGDFGELAAATATYLKMTGVDTKNSQVTYPIVEKIFNAFMASVATKARPFYFHTSTEKMLDVFKKAKDEGVNPRPVIFPEA